MALDTTTGSPQASAIRSAARTPPSGWTLSTTMSAAPAARTASGSSARRIDSSAASGTSTRPRSSAISGNVAHGCSAYSRPNLASSASIRSACPTSHAPLASTRIRPAGPRARRTAATLAMSASAGWPRSATFTLAVRQPEAETIACAAAGPTAGTVTFTGTRSRTGAGQPSVAASTAQASQRALSFGPYSANGENSAHPAGPSISAPSRTMMPRNRVRIGMANARSPGSRPAARSRRPPAACSGCPLTAAAGTWRSPGGASP